MIKAEVLQNNVILIKNNVVADSVKFETIEFKFPKAWELFTKTAVFYKADGTAVNIVLSKNNTLCKSENECFIPFEVLKAPGFDVSVFGVLDDKIATATKAYIKVLESGYKNGTAPALPTATEYQQIISLSESTRHIAESVREDADNGLFKGEKGDTGPKGEKGDPGPKGEEGTKTDRSYNPESENAQSGKAIASALANYLPLDTQLELELDGGNAGGMIDIEYVVDSEISDTSPNPVENRVVKQYVDAIIGENKFLVDSEISDTSFNPVQNKVIKQHLDNLANRVDAIIDYPIEEGNYNNWHYRKMKNGGVELWGFEKFENLPININSRGAFTSNVLISELPFPIYADVDKFIISTGHVSQGMWLGNAWAEHGTNIYRYSIMRAATAEGETAEARIYIKGRWKEV